MITASRRVANRGALTLAALAVLFTTSLLLAPLAQADRAFSTGFSVNATVDLTCAAINTGPDVAVTTVTNSASVSSTTSDSNPSNNTASVTFTTNGASLNAGSGGGANSHNSVPVKTNR